MDKKDNTFNEIDLVYVVLKKNFSWMGASLTRFLGYIIEYVIEELEEGVFEGGETDWSIEQIDEAISRVVRRKFEREDDDE